jgi:hypothetical protein
VAVQKQLRRESFMLDLVFVAVIVVFFVVALGYAQACDRGIGAS